MPSAAERSAPAESAAPVAAVPFVLACATLAVVIVLDSAAAVPLLGLWCAMWLAAHRRSERRRWSDVGRRVVVATALAWSAMWLTLSMAATVTEVGADRMLVVARWPLSILVGVIPRGADGFGATFANLFGSVPGNVGPHVRGANDCTTLLGAAGACVAVPAFLLSRAAIDRLLRVTPWLAVAAVVAALCIVPFGTEPPYER